MSWKVRNNISNHSRIIIFHHHHHHGEDGSRHERPLYSRNRWKITNRLRVHKILQLFFSVKPIGPDSWARRFAVASQRFIGRRSASRVLSQDCLNEQTSIFSCQVDPRCRPGPGELGDDPSWGRRDEDVQRTDGDGGQYNISLLWEIVVNIAPVLWWNIYQYIQCKLTTYAYCVFKLTLSDWFIQKIIYKTIIM